MNDPENSMDRLERLAGGYAAAGLPLTSQRRTLIEVIAGRTDHPTVDQIYSAVAERLPEISRTTVYRSLEVLTDLKLLTRVEHPGSAVRFDPNTHPHHHFLCTTCGGLVDLPLDAVVGSEALSYTVEPPAVAETVTVLVRGTCAECVRSGGEPRRA